MVFALDLLGNKRCRVCMKRIYFWQRVEWSSFIGENIHYDCGEAYDTFTLKQKMEIAKPAEKRSE